MVPGRIYILHYPIHSQNGNIEVIMSSWLSRYSSDAIMSESGSELWYWFTPDVIPSFVRGTVASDCTTNGYIIIAKSGCLINEYVNAPV